MLFLLQKYKKGIECDNYKRGAIITLSIIRGYVLKLAPLICNTVIL